MNRMDKNVDLMYYDSYVACNSMIYISAQVHRHYRNSTMGLDVLAMNIVTVIEFNRTAVVALKFIAVWK